MLRFVIHSTYDVLPTPKNISVWNSDSDPKCHKCGAIGTLKHLLSACPRSLADGMYTWRHNQVLEAFRDTLTDAIDEANKENTTQKVPNIQFHKEGQQPISTPSKPKHGILATANDWKISVDLENQLVFPREITVTNMRPDIVIWSMSTKTTVIGELTVPWEENVGVANEFKKDKYVELVEQCKSQGFKVLCHPVEIGCRGVGTKSLPSFLCAFRSPEQTEEEINTGGTEESQQSIPVDMEQISSRRPSVSQLVVVVLCHCWPTPLIPDRITDNGPKRSRGARD